VAVSAPVDRVSHLHPKVRDLRGMTLDELERVVIEGGEAAYRARQVMRRLWVHGAESPDKMPELPAELRHYLKQHFRIGTLHTSHVARALDGTRKLLLRLEDGAEIETVIIPGDGRTTLCISSQAGCAMGCQFCATARMGLHRNLAASEVLGQILAAKSECTDGERLTNYVFMGMGEPLANYPKLSRALTIMTAEWGLAISPRRITVSTVGLVPMMERLLTDFPVNLAVSLHATTDRVRDELAPINRRYPLAQLLDACGRLPLSRRNRITFEYVMLSGVNDSLDDASRLLRMLAPIKCKVNLIFFNPFPGAGFQSTPRAKVENFQAILLRGNLTATIRESRGRDIAAACGQLYAERGSRSEEWEVR
jgi:23S rRNA (adenine2503-C2)-methyltransferase